MLLYIMELRTYFVITCLCFELCVFFVSGTKVELKTGDAATGMKEGVPINTGDVIMKEDAQEGFYNVDFDKYEGINCPPPQAPENGIIVGEGNEVGSVVYVQCEDGYYLSGPTVMACSPVDESVKWDPDVGRKCIKGETFFQESHSEERKPQEDVSSEDFPPPFPRWDRHREELKADWPLDEVRRRVELEDFLPPKCHLKPEKGPCESSFRRFYFDKSTMECAEFFYGGCEGNENNFDTLANCNRACLRKLP